jgi:hypothetical protein
VTKTTVKTTGLKVGELVPQAHGGALRNGGTNKGGAGRPKARIQAKMRGALEDNLHVANDILQDDEAKASDKLGALTFLARFGLGGKREGITVDAALLNEFFAVIERHVTDMDALAEIRENWLDILASRVGA